VGNGGKKGKKQNILPREEKKDDGFKEAMSKLGPGRGDLLSRYYRSNTKKIPKGRRAS